jgi:hypothetical protein
MKVIVLGNSKYKKWKQFKDSLKSYLIELQGSPNGEAKKNIEILIGNGSTFDKMAKKFCENYEIPYRTFSIDWYNVSFPNATISYDTKGKEFNANAGFQRNDEMIEYVMESHFPNVVVFGSSEGVEDIVKKSNAQRIPVKRFEESP